MRFCSFSSGSSGNSYMISSGADIVLVDAGIAARDVLGGIIGAGEDPERVRAVLITHEHSDHIKGLGPVSRKFADADIYMSRGTLDMTRTVGAGVLAPGEKLYVGGLRIEAFSVSHDAADPVAYTLGDGEKSLSILTDTGMVSDEMIDAIAPSDLIVLEANHDVKLLISGRYPPHLKRRILSEHGHLSNAQAAEAIIKIMKSDDKPRAFLLAHLSRDNNYPDLALRTVRDAVSAAGYKPGTDLYIGVLLRDRVSNIFLV